MKLDLKIGILSILLCIGSLPAWADDLFSSLNDNPNVDIVYVSKEMLLSADASRAVLYNNLHLYTSEKLESLYIYSSNNEEGIEAISKALKDVTKNNSDLKILMSSKSAKEKSTIYGIKDQQDPRFFKNVIIETQGKSYSMIVLSGLIWFQNGSGG